MKKNVRDGLIIVGMFVVTVIFLRLYTRWLMTNFSTKLEIIQELASGAKIRIIYDDGFSAYELIKHFGEVNTRMFDELYEEEWLKPENSCYSLTDKGKESYSAYIAGIDSIGHGFLVAPNKILK